MLQDIVKKIKHIEIRTRHVVNTTFAGEYHSVFKGQGINFAEVREYHPGDDVRLIDWNVTARAGKPHIKVFDEERELTVILMVDVSASGCFGSQKTSKRDMFAEVAAVLGFSAAKNQDKVGLVLCTDRIEKVIPPKRGRDHVLRLIRDLYCFEPERPGTYLSAGFEYLLQVHKRRAVVFVISDFWDFDFSNAFNIVAKRHEIVPVVMTDPHERMLPDAGLLWLEDAESGQVFPIDAGNPEIQKQYKERSRRIHTERDLFFKRANVTPVYIDTAASYVGPLRKYFAARSRKNR